MKGNVQAMALHLSKSRPAILPAPGMWPFSQVQSKFCLFQELPPISSAPQWPGRYEAPLVFSVERAHCFLTFLSAMWTPVSSGHVMPSWFHLILKGSLFILMIHTRTLMPREIKCTLPEVTQLVNGLSETRTQPFVTCSQAWLLPLDHTVSAYKKRDLTRNNNYELYWSHPRTSQPLPQGLF